MSAERNPERERLMNWAKELASPDWCLSVPPQAKQVITQLTSALEAVESEAKRLDALADGDKYYAKRFRSVVASALGIAP